MLGLIGAGLLFPEKFGKPALEGLGNLWDDVTGVSAAEEAAKAQADATAAASDTLGDQQDTQMEMLDKILEQYAPYTEAGQQALSQMQNLTGAAGEEAQQQAIQGIQNSPMFQAQLQQGEDALLQNAAATGGLRGGNTQGALAQYRPALLQSAIQQQIGNLGGIAGMGSGAAGGAASGIGGTAGALGGLAGGIAGLQQQQGNIGSSLALSQYDLQSSFLKDLAGLGLSVAGLF